MKNNSVLKPNNLSSGAKMVWHDVIDAMQQAEEIGGVRDLQDYIRLMTQIKHEVEVRIINATGIVGNISDNNYKKV